MRSFIFPWLFIMWHYLSQLLQPCGLFDPCTLNAIHAQGLTSGPMTTEFVPLNNSTTSLFWCDPVWSIPNWQSRSHSKSFLFYCIFKLWNTSNMLEKNRDKSMSYSDMTKPYSMWGIPTGLQSKQWDGVMRAGRWLGPLKRVLTLAVKTSNTVPALF